jgi:aspartyl aminopeptidase
MNDFVKGYMDMLDIGGTHELFTLQYMENMAIKNGYVPFKENNLYRRGSKLIFRYRDKFLALVRLGIDITQGANIIVSHVDSPRLDVIVGKPIIENEDGVFFKVIPYGGIITQSWLDRPLALVGRVQTDDGITYINTKGDYDFTVTSLLPHLNGAKEMKELSQDKLLVRIGNNKKESVLKFLETYSIKEEDLELADLSFVPSDDSKLIGFDKELIAGYGHDDKSCAYAELRAMLDAKHHNERTTIAIFASYEETGSAQTTGCQSEFIDDMFLELTHDVIRARRSVRNSNVISADVCAGFESTYANHFEPCAKAIVGQGVGIIPYLGKKRGNDTEFDFRTNIKQLALDNDVKYQIETTKVTEGGGGTVSTFFAVRGCHVIDVGVPVLAMHSPQEVISKHDLYECYKLYRAFYEN